MKEVFYTVVLFLLVGGCGKSCKYIIDNKNNTINQNVYKIRSGLYELRTKRIVNSYYKIDSGSFKEIDSIKVFRYYEAIISIDTVKHLESKTN
mgnify:CR=1 FL=1